MRILESFVASPFAGTIGWTLLHSLWEGAAISALLATVVLATRSARVRYAAACAAMIAMVVAFAVTLYQLMPESAQNFPRFRTMLPLAPLPNVAAQADYSRTWLSILSMLAPWLAPFWFGGMFLLSLQPVMSCIAVRRLRSRGVCFASEEWHAELARLAVQLRVSRPVHLLESCFAEIPMVLGHLQPVILVPIGLLANLPSEQVETILLHELAHIRRCDYLVNALQRIVESVLFYNPAVWWISKVMRTERENCCDDVVVSVSQHAHEYARALATLERNRLPRQEAAVAATGGTLVKRIRRLLNPKAPAGIWAPVAATAMFVVTAAVSFAAWQPKPAQSTPIKAQAQTPAATNVPVKTFYLVNSETPEHMDKIVTALREVLDSQSVQAVYAKKAIIVRDTPEMVAVAGKIIDVEENQTVSGSATKDHAEQLRLQVATLENLVKQNSLTDAQQLRNAIVLENSDPARAKVDSPQKAPVAVAPQTDKAAQDLREWIVQRLSLPNGTTASQANSVVAQLLLQYGPGHAEYDRAQNVIIIRGSPDEIPGAKRLIDLAGGAPANAPAPPSQPAPKDFVVMAQQGESNGRGGQTVFGISETMQKWLNEDVVYIITDEERDTFLHLNTDEERQQFVKAFWERRNPAPGSADNKFKDEHYRRIAYSNEHFGMPSGKAGWQTDRGHIYIVYGPPNAQDHFVAGANGNTFASERWHYNHIDGVGDNLIFEFVDRGGNGDFVLVPSPSNSQVIPKPGASSTGKQTGDNLYSGNPADNSLLRRQSVSDSHLHDSMFVRDLSLKNQVTPETGASNATTQPNEFAKEGVTILSPTEGVDFSPYIKEMLKSIQTHWYNVMPQEATKGQASGQVSVIFSIQPDGKLLYWQIPASSGVPSFDDAARDAVRDSFPLQPLPKDFHGSYLKLKLTFAYNQPLRS